MTALNKTAVGLGTFRFALAIMVIAIHTPHYLESWPNIGSIAVAVFFFISGFLMPLAFESNYKFTAFGDRAVRFWANRILKIYPWYWLSILAPLALVFFRGANNEAQEIYFYPTVLLQNALLLGLNQEQLWGQYLRYNNPAWTLDVELQYYLLVPALMWGYSKSPKFLTTFMIGSAALSIYLLIAPTEKIYIDRSLLTWAALFFGGFLYFQAHIEKFPFRTKNFALVGILVTLTAMPFPEPIRTPAIAIGLLLIAAHLLKVDETGTKNRINKFLGDLSYPIYIFHYFLIGPIQARSAPIFEAMGLSSSVLFFAIFLLNVIVCLFVCSLVVFWGDPIIEKYRSLLRS